MPPASPEAGPLRRVAVRCDPETWRAKNRRRFPFVVRLGFALALLLTTSSGDCADDDVGSGFFPPIVRNPVNSVSDGPLDVERFSNRRQLEPMQIEALRTSVVYGALPSTGVQGSISDAASVPFDESATHWIAEPRFNPSPAGVADRRDAECFILSPRPNAGDDLHSPFPETVPSVGDSGFPEAVCDCRCDCRVYAPRLRFTDDLHGFFPMLRDDARDIFCTRNAAILGVALGGALAVRNNLDDDARAYSAPHPNRWGESSRVLGGVGEIQYQVPAVLGVYAWSLHTQDEELHGFSKSLVSAFTLTGLSTLVVKAAVNTERPSDRWNDGQYGFPSYHTASSFAIASVVDEYYGPKAGLPAYAVAGLIGWSRIDERDHDLSDVVFGAALGLVIGHSVAGRHLESDRVRLSPYVHPTDGAAGAAVEFSY